MSQPRFLADQDLNHHIVEGVRRREPLVEFVLLRDVGLSAEPDDRLLEWAATQGLIIVSHVSNTMTAAAYAPLSADKLMTGLFVVPQRATLSPVIEDLILIWSASEAEELIGVVKFLPFSR